MHCWLSLLPDTAHATSAFTAPHTSAPALLLVEPPSTPSCHGLAAAPIPAAAAAAAAAGDKPLLLLLLLLLLCYQA
jgi:hypothetical protein